MHVAPLDSATASAAAVHAAWLRPRSASTLTGRRSTQNSSDDNPYRTPAHSARSRTTAPPSSGAGQHFIASIPAARHTRQQLLIRLSASGSLDQYEGKADTRFSEDYLNPDKLQTDDTDVEYEHPADLERPQFHALPERGFCSDPCAPLYDPKHKRWASPVHAPDQPLLLCSISLSTGQGVQCCVLCLQIPPLLPERD